DPVPPRRLNAKVPRDLETVALECLAKDPRKRYASAAELAADLRRWSEGKPILARRMSRREQAWNWVKHRPRVAALWAAVVLSLLAGTAVRGASGVEAPRRAEAARQAFAEVEVALADGYLRALGHSPDETGPLHDIELAALKELASLPPEYRRVRL